MLREYKRKIEKHFEEVLRIKTSPHSIALGFAIGTAIAVLPTFGLGVLIGLLVVLIFEKVSKISLFAGLAVFNPLITVSLYGLAFKIGDFVLSSSPVKTYKFWLWNQQFNYSRRFLVGNLILTVILTTLSYIIVYIFAKRYYKKYEKIVEKL